MTSLESVADQVLSLVDGRADEASVTLTEQAQGLTRFATSFIHQNVGDQHTAVDLTVAVDGRVATSSSSLVSSPEALVRLVDSTLAAAHVQPVDQGWPGVAPPSSLPSATSAWDEATAAAGPAERAAVVASFVAAAGGLEAAGYCETVAAHVLLVTTAGQRIDSRYTTATIDGIARTGGCDGVGASESSRLGDLDGSVCGAMAAASASQSAADGGPIDHPPGRWEVVLSPRCVAYMLDFFTVYGFNAKMVREGQSFAAVGETQLDEQLSIWDDATDPRHVGARFDVEGTPKRQTSLVEGGRVVGLTHDRRTAGATGSAESTGHAVGSASMGAIATNLFLSGSSPQPVEQLISGVERGLLVRDFWYTRVLNPKSLVVTGLTRNGVFVIEDGVVGRPVSNLRFTQSPVAAFGPGRVLAVGDDARLAPGGLHVSSHHTPSLRLASWNFTGGAGG